MNKLKQSLKNNTISIGTWLQIGHPAIAEILAARGFDWVCADIEHGIIDLEIMANLFRAIERFDCIPVARIPANDPIWIHRVLDAGARGIIIPMIKNRAEAVSAIEESKYPPAGVRGFGYSRANCYGSNFDEYIKQANDDIAVILQIEHIDAISNLEEIMSLEGFDGTFIGPLDLAGSMKLEQGMDDSRFKDALAKYIKICQKYDKPPGMHIVRPNRDNIKESIENGYKMIALGLDVVFLEEKADELLKMTSLPG